MADYTSKTAPTKENPIGLEVPVKSIQLDLATITWLELSYGRAILLPVEPGNNKQVPMVYVGGRQHKEVLPNDNLKSQSFIAITSPETIEEFNHNAKSQTKEVDIAIIIWVNFEKIDPNRKDIFIEELKNNVAEVLAFNEHIISIDEIIDENALVIFSPYNIDICDNELLMYPYGGMRFNCTIGFESFCI